MSKLQADERPLMLTKGEAEDLKFAAGLVMFGDINERREYFGNSRRVAQADVAFDKLCRFVEEGWRRPTGGAKCGEPQSE